MVLVLPVFVRVVTLAGAPLNLLYIYFPHLHICTHMSVGVIIIQKFLGA